MQKKKMRQKNGDTFGIEASPSCLLVMNSIKICQKVALLSFSTELNKNPPKKGNACVPKLTIPHYDFLCELFKTCQKKQHLCSKSIAFLLLFVMFYNFFDKFC